MRIIINAKPNSYQEKIKKISDTEFVVSVKEPPVKGLANEAIIRALADYFDISPFRVRIVSGWASKRKVAEIL